MLLDNYYFIYSAMTQSIGALIALVGVFIIFRIQIQRDRLSGVYAGLRQLEFPNSSRKEIDKGVKDKLKNKGDTSKIGPINKEVVQLCVDLVNHKNILEYTIRQGKKRVIEISLLFIYYIVALNGNSLLYDTPLKSYILFIGAFWAIYVVVRITLYIKNIVKVEEEEFLGE